ncbi:MAG: tripartite tricarboxylate transporter substrate binding protein [Reyranellaceae bacterium]
MLAAPACCPKENQRFEFGERNRQVHLESRKIIFLMFNFGYRSCYSMLGLCFLRSIMAKCFGNQMKLVMRRRMASFAMLAIPSGTSLANSWPDQSISWVAPFGRGTSGDLYLRTLAGPVSRILGQEVLVENRSGGNGTLATVLFLREPQIGKSFLAGYTALAYARAIYPKSGAGFDFSADLIPITGIAREPFVLVCNSVLLDVATLKDFINRRFIDRSPITIGSEGLGTVSHLAVELLQARTGATFKHIPFQGAVAAVNALRSGSVAAAFVPVYYAREMLRAETRVHALAISGRRRDERIRSVPTFEEAGLPGFLVTQWFGLFAARGTPSPILDRLHSAVEQALQTGEVRNVWESNGARVEIERREDFAEFVRRDSMRWSKIASDARLNLD